MDKYKIVKCVVEDDLNFGGWDILVRMEDGSYACFAEVTAFDRAIAIMNGSAPEAILDRTRRRLTAIRDGAR